MKRKYKPDYFLKPWPRPGTLLMIQASLPFPFDNPAKLLTLTGQGTASGRAAPLAPPKETAHD